MFWYEIFFKNRINPFQQSDAFHIETSHLFCRAKNDWFLYETQHWAKMGLFETILKFCKLFAIKHRSFKAAMDFQFPRFFG